MVSLKMVSHECHYTGKVSCMNGFTQEWSHAWMVSQRNGFIQEWSLTLKKGFYPTNGISMFSHRNGLKYGLTHVLTQEWSQSSSHTWMVSFMVLPRNDLTHVLNQEWSYWGMVSLMNSFTHEWSHSCSYSGMISHRKGFTNEWSHS